MNLKQSLKSFFIPGEENDYKPHALRDRALLIYAILLLLLKIFVFVFIVFFPGTGLFSTINSQQILQLINQERNTQGLTSLVLNNKLVNTANDKANDMFSNNYFDHNSPIGKSPWYWFSKNGYQYLYAGENLAMDFYDSKEVVSAWMASGSHRANILNKNYKEVGVSVQKGEIQSRQTTIAVLLFGSQKIALAKTSLPEITQPKTAQEKPSSFEIQEPLEKNQTQGLETKPSEIAVKETPKPEELTLKSALKPEEFQLIEEKIVSFSSHILIPILDIDEITHQLYLYFSLFLIIALAINILVKIRIQHLPTIILTIILIGLSVGMIFV